MSFRVKSYLATPWKLSGFCDGMGENWNFPTCMMSRIKGVRPSGYLQLQSCGALSVVRPLEADMSGVKQLMPSGFTYHHFAFRPSPCVRKAWSV